MTSTRLELDKEQLRRLYQSSGLVYVYVERFIGRVLTRGKLYAPVDKGYLRNTLTSVVRNLGASSVGGAVGSPADYAAAVHEGRAARTVRAPGSGVLVFNAGGRRVYTTSVRQPATKGRPFLRRALEEETRKSS